MGASWYAYTVMGVKLDQSKLFNTVADPIKCGHVIPLNSKFCPECGIKVNTRQQRIVNKLNGVSDSDEFDHKWKNWNIVKVNENDVLIGIVSEVTDYGDKNPKRLADSNYVDMGDVCNRLLKDLQGCKVTVASSEFGIWTYLGVSI